MNNPITKKKAKIALIHVAKTKTGLTDDEYRALLFGAAGIESASELEREDQFQEIMEAFKQCGFVSSKPLTCPRWEDSWGGTAGQRAKIEALWRLATRDKSGQALRRFLLSVLPAWIVRTG